MVTTDEAIRRLSSALAIVSNEGYDNDTVRVLTKEIVDEKHRAFIEKGLADNDTSSLLHGLLGALSHYEAEKEQQERHPHYQ